jgi:hypothetical protein
VKVSLVATQMLIGKCGKPIVTDSATRSNSVYFMISRLIEIKPALSENLEELTMDSLLFTELARLVELKKFCCNSNNKLT